MNDEWCIHAKNERTSDGFDALCTAIGIAGKIRLAHPADEIQNTPPVCERRSSSKKKNIAARNKARG